MSHANQDLQPNIINFLKSKNWGGVAAQGWSSLWGYSWAWSPEWGLGSRRKEYCTKEEDSAPKDGVGESSPGHRAAAAAARAVSPSRPLTGQEQEEEFAVPLVQAWSLL